MDVRKKEGRLAINRRRAAAVAGLLLVVVTAAGRAEAADDGLQDVRRLFASAAYDEPLSALVRLDDPALLDAADEYRALCLLALGRDGEAERALELLVLRHPQPLAGLDGRAPRFTAMYRGVRSRLVPRLAASAYNAARDSYVAGDYGAAARQFDEVLALAKDAEDPAALRDLAMLAAGFRTLAAAQIEPVRLASIPEVPLNAMLVPAIPVDAAAIVPPAPRARASASSSASEPPARFAPIPRVYGADDRDVTPPIALDQQLPSWSPPSELFLRHTFTGQLRVLVGEDGRVLSAEITRPSFVLYDEVLLRRARQWRYQPALKLDRAVQYRRVIDYVLNGDQTAASR